MDVIPTAVSPRALELARVEIKDELSTAAITHGLDLEAARSLLPILRGQPAPMGPRDLYFVRREGGAAYGGGRPPYLGGAPGMMGGGGNGPGGGMKAAYTVCAPWARTRTWWKRPACLCTACAMPPSP